MVFHIRVVYDVGPYDERLEGREGVGEEMMEVKRDGEGIWSVGEVVMREDDG